MEEPAPNANARASSRPRTLARSVVGALLPLAAFWLVERYAPLAWAIVAGMVAGLAETAWSYARSRKVDGLTAAGTALVVVTGLLSLATESAALFKLKPALVEVALGVFLVGSAVVGRPALLAAASARQKIPETRKAYFTGASIRFGATWLLHAVAAGYAALYLSSDTWLAVKGVGVLVCLAAYAGFEVLYIRWVMRPRWLAREAELRAARAAAPPSEPATPPEPR